MSPVPCAVGRENTPRTAHNGLMGEKVHVYAELGGVIDTESKVVRWV